MAQGLGQPRLLQELEHAVRNKTSWLWLGPRLTESQKTLLRPVGERLRLQQCPRLWVWYLNRICGGRGEGSGSAVRSRLAVTQVG